MALNIWEELESVLKKMKIAFSHALYLSMNADNTS